MIAHLGMYGSPALNQAFWRAIRAQLGFGPDSLNMSDDFWPFWQSPDLLFSQTCGYPYRKRLHGLVQLVGTPDYAIPGCPPGYYNSVIVARADDPRDTLAEFEGADFAYNKALSQSGWAAPVHHMRERGVTPGRLVRSGAHAASMTFVANRDADFAGIDAVSFAMARRSGGVEALKVIARTAPTPGLPYITGSAFDPEQIFAAVQNAITNLDDATRTALKLRPPVHIPADAYLSVSTPPPPEDIAPLVTV